MVLFLQETKKLELIFFFCSLKRTTDVMFGGKQVLVCGYGEVNDKLSSA